MLDSLNRDYWEKYLHYPMLEQWRKAGKPTEEEKQHYVNIAVKLEVCLQFQRMLERVRGVQ